MVGMAKSQNCLLTAMAFGGAQWPGDIGSDVEIAGHHRYGVPIILRLGPDHEHEDQCDANQGENGNDPDAWLGQGSPHLTGSSVRRFIPATPLRTSGWHGCAPLHNRLRRLRICEACRREPPGSARPDLEVPPSRS